MIKDNIKNSKTYYNISENLKAGFEWLNTTDLKSLQDGRYEVSDKIYANVQSYNTKDSAPFEAHRKYIDIQYMISGKEFIGITNYENCSTKIDYDGEKDIEFLECDKNREELLLNESEFAVFFPQDAHQPSLNPKDKLFVKKVIVKVAV